VFSQVSIRVSIKTRLGERDPAEIDRLIPVFNRYPLCEVIVHPRIATGQYEGTVDLEAFERVARLIVHPVVYNGDIFSAAQFAQMRLRFPMIRRWMIGRGALFNPYLPSEIRGVPRVDAVERRKALGAFHDQLYAAASAERSGFSHVHARMVQIWEYLSVAMGADGHFEKKLRKAKTPAMYDSLVRPLLDR